MTPSYPLDSVTTVLGIEPSGTQVSGGKRYTDKHGRFKPAAVGLWKFAAPVESPHLGDEIDSILKMLGNTRQSLDKLDGVECALFDILLLREDKESLSDCNTEVFISPTQLERLARLGLTLAITYM
jgi:hypothetical protein